MSLHNTIYGLSNLNAVLGSAVGYAEQRENGVPAGNAMMNFGMNIFNGGMRNVVARDMQQRTGSTMGYLVNNLAGYGNSQANYMGTMGLMGASMFSYPLAMGGCSPFFGSSMYGSSMYGGSMFGGGMFGGGMFGASMLGGGMFGGCGCNSMSPFMGYSTNMFMSNRFMC